MRMRYDVLMLPLLLRKRERAIEAAATLQEGGASARFDVARRRVITPKCLRDAASSDDVTAQRVMPCRAMRSCAVIMLR